jgi:thiol-disulfide isomerase/thioredoxin
LRNPILVVVLALVASIAAAGPAVFQNLTPEKAVERAKEDGRLVVIDFTAEWCGPCKQMDRITWSNASVVKWLNDNAVAIQVDVDHDRKSAGKFRVRAMPTVVVMRDGKEIDRAVGLKDADAFLKWMFALKGGKTEAEVRKHEIEAMPDGPERAAQLMQQRMSNAQNLAMMGKDDEALEEYLWLWKNVHKEAPSMSAVRLSFLVSYIQQFAAQHPPAVLAFTKERDALTPMLNERPIDRETLIDWIVLNDMVGDEKATLSFIDEIKTEPNANAVLSPHEYILTPLLIANGRWADAGAIIDPAREISMIKTIREFEAKRPAMRGMPDMSSMEISRLANQYAALLAAGRKADAQGFAEAAFDLYEAPRVQVTFVEMAVKAKQATREHLVWLDEAADAGYEAQWVRKSLDEALAGQGRR